MADQQLTIVLKATDKGLVGVVKGASSELQKLDRSAKNTGVSMGRAFDSGIQSTRSFVRELGLLIGAGGLITGFKTVVDEMDAMAKASQKVGLTVEQLSSLKHAADLSGVSFEQLQTGLEQFNRRLAESATGTDKASKLLRGLGIDASQGVEPALRKLADTFQGTQDGVAKTATAMELFGRAGGVLIPSPELRW